VSIVFDVVLLAAYGGLVLLLLRSVFAHPRSTISSTLAFFAIVILAAAATQALATSRHWWPTNAWGTPTILVAAIAVLAATIGLAHTVPRIISFRDRQHLHAAERELRESKARFERAIQGASQGLWEWNIQADEMWFAPRFKELLGYSSSEFPNTFQSWESALHPDDRQQTLDALRAHLDRDDAYEIEHRLRTRSGNYRWFHTRGMAIRDPEGRPYLLSGSMHDVHERRVAEDLVRQRDLQLQQRQKMEAIGELAAGIVHEINTPIQCVGMNLDFIKDSYEHLCELLDAYHDELEGPSASWESRKSKIAGLLADGRRADVRENVAAAVNEASLAVKHITEIALAMKTISHPGVREKVLTNLGDLIRSATVISRNRWKYCAQLEFDFDESLHEIEVFPTELQQVIVNLLVNAADAIVQKHGQGNPELGKITIRSCAPDNSVRIEVEDNGCGMTDEVQQRIFTPFFTTKGVGKGTGQGLAISYSAIVEKHGGTIEVQTEPGIGTKFTICLPQVHTDQQRDHQATVVDQQELTHV
jgi:PAS domain S-box-containing protein